MFVVDSSVFASVLVKDEYYGRARSFLVGRPVPSLEDTRERIYGEHAKSLKLLIESNVSRIYDPLRAA